jgi:hypothetical protein
MFSWETDPSHALHPARSVSSSCGASGAADARPPHRGSVVTVDAEELLRGRPAALAIYRRVVATVAELGPSEVRATKSQVAFRRERGFAYLWVPGQYLRNPCAEVVLSIALGRHVPSQRFKQVAHPATDQWMHHLELHGPDDVDDEVVAWLREAFERAV